MAQIVNMLIDALVEHLTTEMRAGLTPSDLTYPDTIKRGLLQQEKIIKNVALGVTGGDHEDPNLRDGISTLEELPNIGWIVPVREVGGGQTWWRRGVVRLECYFVRERLTEEQAFVAAYEVLGRLQSVIETLNLSGLGEDDYGERALQIFCYGNTYSESGGPPKTYIFRGKVLWQVLTERP
jgi:hypothetical protein